VSSAITSLTEALPNLPRDQDGPVFREPWEAQAFAMAVSLRERGLFTWGEWAATLGAQIKSAAGPDDGSNYYHHWLAALERIVAAKGAADPATLARYKHAWEHAADRTPHGQPIELIPGDFHSAKSGG
jgi:nitrile hydratase accessory protein